MSAEELDAELGRIGDWFVASVSGLQKELSDKIEAALSQADGVPAHLAKASAAKLFERMSAIDTEPANSK